MYGFFWKWRFEPGKTRIFSCICRDEVLPVCDLKKPISSDRDNFNSKVFKTMGM
jgi:hypothetical protein